MFLVNLRKTLVRKSLRGAHQSWPKTSMHISDLAVNEPTDEHVRTVSDNAS